MATTNPTAEYWQRGESLDYANETAKVISAGTVIDLKERIGVAGTDILPGRVGSIHVMGVYSMAKAESKEIAMGASVYFKAEDGTITDEVGENTPAGYAAAKAESADATILVNIGFPPAKAVSGSSPDMSQYQKKITATGILKGEGDGTVSAAAEGTDYTKVKKLSDLDDVDETAATAGQALKWDDSSSKWKPQDDATGAG